MNASRDENVENPCEYMASLSNTYLPLDKWGFKEVHRSDQHALLVYESKWCRIRFVWLGWEMYTGNTIAINYGRLHAPFEKEKMTWGNEECYCWHDFSGTRAILDFIDGLTPRESVDLKGFPPVIGEFRKSDLWNKLAGKRHQPELAVQMNAAIWEYYDSRLFHLFDLNHSGLWLDYRRFLKGIYDIKGRDPNIQPPLDQVC